MKYNLLNITSEKSNKCRTIHNYFGIFLLMLIVFYLIAGVYVLASGCINTKTLPIFQQGKDNSANMQQLIANELIRFHVVGNSDTDKDQAVKLLVKDEIINYLKPYLSSVSSKKEAESVILFHIDNIINAAQKKLSESGFSYMVSVSLSPTYFPIKVYGDISLPAGTYDALVVSLGEAKGQNWWCIMFPQLCFIDDSYSVVPDTSKAKLKYFLTEDEYEAILTSPPEVKYKFKIIEWLKNIF